MADAAEVLVALRQWPQPEVLRHVGVLVLVDQDVAEAPVVVRQHLRLGLEERQVVQQQVAEVAGVQRAQARLVGLVEIHRAAAREVAGLARRDSLGRSEEHTSELQSLMRSSYAVFCLKKTKKNKNTEQQ